MVTAPGATAVTSPVAAFTVAVAALLVDHETGWSETTDPSDARTVAVSWTVSPGCRLADVGAVIVTLLISVSATAGMLATWPGITRLGGLASRRSTRTPDALRSS